MVSYLVNDSQKNEISRIDSIITFEKDETILKRKKQAFEIPIKRTKKKDTQPFKYSQVSKIMAIGDLHGEFDSFSNFLIKNKVINESYNWTFGKGHLVLAGDIFDRGPDVIKCFWLLYKLENEAVEHGGRVHFILGNHEIMQIRGDKRYLAKKHLNLFNSLGLDYTRFYKADTELGKWLRTKNTIIKLNDIIFVHGGISPELVDNKLKINLINSTVRNIINRKVPQAITPLEEFILSNIGPLWYRGYIKLSSSYYDETSLKYEITQEKVDKITRFYSAKAIVFANTHVKEISPMFNFKLFGIDIPFAELNIEFQGLYIEDGHFYKALSDGTKKIIY